MGKSKFAGVTGAPLAQCKDKLLVWHGSVSVICFLLIFGSTLPPLYNDWRTFDTFSHGLLVPLIAGYMVWQKRAQLSRGEIAPTSWGLLLLFPAVLLGVLGKIIGDGFTERVGLVLCLGGLVWVLLGWQWFKRLSFPLGYLFLMIPLPYTAVKEVAYHLRILNASLAAPALRALGIPVYRDSYYLHLPDITLEVADLCSGISSVFALFALGAAYIYFTPLRPQWKFVALMSTVPFAAFVNLLRIILTAALAHYVSLAVLGVLIHELTGTITFFIALLLFIGLSELLQRKFSRSRSLPDPAKNRIGASAVTEAAASETRSWRPFVAGLAVLIPAVFFTLSLKAEATLSLKQDLGTLRREIAGFRTDDAPGTESYREPNAHQELARTYVGPSGEWLELYLGFRGEQSGNKRIGSPKLQFPFGWNYVWMQSARVPSSDGALVDANWMMTQNNQQHVLVLYWYQRGSKTFASEIENRLEQVRGALFDQRTDGAIVRLATPAEPDKIERAKARLSAFAGGLYPELLRIFPE